MKKILLIIMALCIGLTACVEFDASTLITDDNGKVHRTIHHLRDKRGRNYYPVKIKSIGERQFFYDPKASNWAAYDAEGNRIMTGAASGGKDICEEDGKSCRTPTGTFRIYNKRGLECKSGEYPVETNGGTKMPYCMYFYRGFAIHAGYEIPEFPASHGCIRVFPSAAKWLNEEFLRIGTKVTVLAYPDQNGVQTVAALR